MIDDRTSIFSLPLPNANNSLSDDVARLRSALAAIDSALASRQAISEKGAANGYAPLDSLGKVPSANLPSFVDDVLEVANYAALPATGETGKIYVTLDNSRTYRWGGSAYVQIHASPGTTDDIVEGLMNLFFTPARARAAQNIATPSQLGLVKIGSNLVIDENGLLSAPGSQSATNTFVDQYFTPTAGQMTFTVTGGYVVGKIEVFLNGVLLFADDYTATNGVHVVLSAGVATTDTLLVRKWSSFDTALLATQAEAEAGTDQAKLMTPLRVAQEIVAQAKLSISSRTANTMLAVADRAALINITSGTFTQTFDAVATLKNGWYCYIKNSGTGDITLDPNASELIDGLTSYVMYPGEMRLIQCDGTKLTSVVLAPFYRTFTASGNFIKPPGYSRFEGLLWGAGGSGGKHSTIGGGGGGGGACNPFIVAASAIASTQPVVIGAGGIAVTTSLLGNVGGNSTFGSITAYGGGPGGSGSPGGGGGGVLSAGANGLGGLPTQDMLGGVSVFGGGCSAASSAGKSPHSGYGGGAGGNSNYSVAGNSVYGGGGGGGSTSGQYTPGTSVYGGSGGAGSDTGSGSNGVVPGGGGGATISGASTGAGARGELRVWGVV